MIPGRCSFLLTRAPSTFPYEYPRKFLSAYETTLADALSPRPGANPSFGMTGLARAAQIDRVVTEPDFLWHCSMKWSMNEMSLDQVLLRIGSHDLIVA